MLHQVLDRGGSDPLPHPKCKLLFSAPVLWLGWWWQQLLGCCLVQGKPLLPSEAAARQPLEWQEGSKQGENVLLVLYFRKDGTLREALV